MNAMEATAVLGKRDTGRLVTKALVSEPLPGTAGPGFMVHIDSNHDPA